MIIVDADTIPFIIEHRNNKYHYDRSTMLLSTHQYIKSIVEDDPYVLAFSTSKSFRNDLYDQYKATRNKVERTEAFYSCKEYIMSNYNTVTVPNYEADDIVYTGAMINPEVVMASCDKDLLQAKGYHYNYSTNSRILVDEGKIIMNNKKLFCTGNYMTANLLIAGDSADNISGIKGMGPVKTYNAIKDLKPDEVLDYARSLYDSDEQFNTNYSLVKLAYINDLNVDYVRL